MPRGVYALGPNKGRGKDWPDAVVERIRTHMATGGTYRTLLAILREEHGYITTRNALIGKAHRMGVQSQNTMRNAAAIRDTHARQKNDRRLVPKQLKIRKPVPETKTLLRADNDPVGKTHGDGYRRKHKPEDIARARLGFIPQIVEDAPDITKPFGELKRDECRWPTAHDASMACGDRATIGSYCDKHALLAYRTMPTRRRNASIRKEQDSERLYRARLDREASDTIEHFIGSPMMHIGLTRPVDALVSNILEDEDDEQ